MDKSNTQDRNQYQIIRKDARNSNTKSFVKTQGTVS